MKRLISSACAAVMVAASIPFATPAAAMPFGAPAVTQGNAIQVQYRDWRRGDARRDWRRGYERRGTYHYYNGHRGYYDYHPGYRRYNGFWFPPAAFIAGAIVGGAIAGPPVYTAPAPVYRSSGSAHVQWCYNRYRSYRASDNTFQPYHGSRRPCYSPYS